MDLNLNILNGRSKLIRSLIIILLVFCLVFGCFAVSYSHAFALPLLGVGAVVAAILIGAGVTANSDSDLASLSQNFFNSCNSGVQGELTELAGRYAANSTGVGFVFHVSSTILTALTEWLIKQSFNFSANGNLSDSTMDTAAYNITSLGSIDLSGLISNEFMENITSESQLSTIPVDSSILDKIIVIDGKYSRLGYVNGTLYSLFSTKLDIINADNWYSFGESASGKCILAKSIYNDYYYLCYYYNGKVSTVSNPIFNSSSIVYGEAGSTFQNTSFPSVNSKCNTTYFPNGVTSAATSSTQFPVGTAEKALTSDLPLTIPADGINSTATTGDVRVGSVSGTGEATGDLTIPQWLQKIFDGIGALGTGIAAIPAAIGSFFDPSKFDLDLSKLKVGLTEVFPFCLPFDFYHSIQIFAADPSDFQFTIDYSNKYFTLDHTVDLQPFLIPIKFFRFIVDFWFGFILISRTRDWIKW